MRKTEAQRLEAACPRPPRTSLSARWETCTRGGLGASTDTSGLGASLVQFGLEVGGGTTNAAGCTPFPRGKGEVPVSHPLPLSHSWLGTAPSPVLSQQLPRRGFTQTFFSILQSKEDTPSSLGLRRQHLVPLELGSSGKEELGGAARRQPWGAWSLAPAALLESQPHPGGIQKAPFSCGLEK